MNCCDSSPLESLPSAAGQFTIFAIRASLISYPLFRFIRAPAVLISSPLRRSMGDSTYQSGGLIRSHGQKHNHHTASLRNVLEVRRTAAGRVPYGDNSVSVVALCTWPGFSCCIVHLAFISGVFNSLHGRMMCSCWNIRLVNLAAASTIWFQ